MFRTAAFVLVLLSVPTAALAQTEGRVSVGASVTFVEPTSDGVKSTVGVGPLVRLNPRRGWGAAGALNWFRANLEDPAGGSDTFARLRVRPLMVGVAYTIGSDRVLTSFSVVAGPSFNSIDFHEGFLRAGNEGARIDVENSIVIRPGINVTWTVAPRVGIIGFGGYAFNRPDIVYVDRFGVENRNRWNADAVVLSVGAVYSLF